jgi:type I restriction enzyme S subunit
VGEWRELSLRDAGVLLIDCDHRTPAAIPSGYPYVAIPQLSDGHIDVSTARRISRADFESWTRKAHPVPHDVVLSRRTNPGVTAYVPEGLEFALGQNLVLLRSDGQTVYPPFLRWLVQGPAWWRQIELFLNVGAVFDSLKCADVPDFRLPIPPLAEQRRIAEILGALDDKIELNRRMTETLEATARTLFRSWFVDFDSRQVSGADDWVDGTLEDLADLNPEVWPSRDRPSVLRYVDLSSTKWGRIGAVTDYPAYEAPSRAQRVLRPGDTIVGTVRPGNGSYALVTRDGLTGSTGFAHLRPKRPRDAAFVYLAATARANIDSLAHLADGGAYPAVRPALVAATPVVVPDDRTLQAFSVAASPLLERAAVALEESEILAAMRDALLPRLLSGAFKVAA